MAEPTLSTPRYPARTVPVGCLSVGLVIRVIVRSGSEWVTAAVISCSSRNVWGSISFAGHCTP